MIRELLAFHERNQAETAGGARLHETAFAKWVVSLAGDGALLGVVAADTSAHPKGQQVIVTQYTTGKGNRIVSRLITETAELALGMEREKDGRKSAARHRAYLELLEACVSATGSADAQAVLTAVKQGIPLPKKMKSSDVVTFRVDNRNPNEDPAVQAFWVQHQVVSRGEHGDAACIITGEVGPVADNFPLLGGVPGGQAKVSLVSANATAYESYGQSGLGTVRISRRAAEGASKGLETLLRDRRYCFRIGNKTAYVFWTSNPHDPGDVMAFLTQPDVTQVQDLLSAPYTGTGTIQEDDTFYFMAVSGNGARVAVRQQVTLGVQEQRAHVRAYLKGMRIVSINGDGPRPFGAYQLLRSLVPAARKAGKKDDTGKYLQGALTDGLVRHALLGHPLPAEILSRALDRVRTEGKNRLPHERAALIRLALASQGVHVPERLTLPEDVSPDVRPAYLCGMLLAALEAQQRRAIPGIRVTLADQMFAMASMHPRQVFGLLLTKAHVHSTKLRNSDPPGFHHHQKTIENIVAQLGPALPDQLPLAHQGAFAIGYHHFVAEQRIRRNAHRAESEMKSALTLPTPTEEN